jgi:hypothetical protein
MPVVRYKLVITGYDSLSEKDRIRPTELIKELFTIEEAQAVRQHLRKTHRWNVEVTPFPLPIDSGYSGFRRYPVGDSSSFYELCNEKGYSLPFKVQGYYDVTGLKPARYLRNVVASIKNSLAKTVRSVASVVKPPSIKRNAAV